MHIARVLSSHNVFMSRDEAEITAMMIPCQWHHTFKYLFKEILQFVFTFFMFSSCATELAPAKHAKYCGWLTSRTSKWSFCKLNLRERNESGAALKSIRHRGAYRKCRRRSNRVYCRATLSSLAKHEPSVEGHHGTIILSSHSRSDRRCNKLQNIFSYNAGFLWYK